MRGNTEPVVLPSSISLPTYMWGLVTSALNLKTNSFNSSYHAYVDNLHAQYYGPSAFTSSYSGAQYSTKQSTLKVL